MSTNTKSYIGKQAAWHNLGLVKNRNFTRAEALIEGGLDYDVFKSQLNDGRGNKVDAWATFRWDRADKLARVC